MLGLSFEGLMAVLSQKLDFEPEIGTYSVIGAQDSIFELKMDKNLKFTIYS